MPGSPNTSFIPKHTTNKTERRNTPRQLFIGTIIVRALFFAVLIASVVVFVYESKLSSKLNSEIEAFKAQSMTFSNDTAKFLAVQSMDQSLAQATDRFNNSVSLVALLKALEVSTVGSAKLNSLSVKREEDSVLVVEGEIKTDNFDSVLFQRSIFEENDVLANAKVKDVKIENLTPTTEEELEQALLGETGIAFKVEFDITPAMIPMVVNQEVLPTAPPDTSPATSVMPETEGENTEANEPETP